MNSKRKFLLFVVDTSRSHGRGAETDYISCTSRELPFVASATLHSKSEYAEMYDPSDDTAIWSEERNGIRMRIRVVSDLPRDYDKQELCSLLRRALKEMLIRRKTQLADLSNITDGNVIKLCTVLREQTVELLRENPDDKQQKMNRAILSRILDVFLAR